MPAKYRQGDRLRMSRMSRTQIQFVYRIVGEFWDTKGRLSGPAIVFLVCRKEKSVRNTYPGYSFVWILQDHQKRIYIFATSKNFRNFFNKPPTNAHVNVCHGVDAAGERYFSTLKIVRKFYHSLQFMY